MNEMHTISHLTWHSLSWLGWVHRVHSIAESLGFWFAFLHCKLSLLFPRLVDWCRFSTFGAQETQSFGAQLWGHRRHNLLVLNFGGTGDTIFWCSTLGAQETQSFGAQLWGHRRHNLLVLNFGGTGDTQH